MKKQIRYELTVEEVKDALFGAVKSRAVERFDDGDLDGEMEWEPEISEPITLVFTPDKDQPPEPNHDQRQ